jgi:hypothetical protein
MQKCSAAPIVGVATRVPVFVIYHQARVDRSSRSLALPALELFAAGAPIAADSVSFFQPGIALPFPRRRP